MKQPEARFWAKVNREGPVPEYAPHLGPCWVWTAALNRAGYGSTTDGKRHRLAHRLAYELTVGPVPAGLELDHLCRVRHCVNPAHLDPVSHSVNMRRSPIALPGLNAEKTHCPKGHEYNEVNTYVCARGQRHCRICHRDRERARVKKPRIRPKRKGSRYVYS